MKKMSKAYACSFFISTAIGMLASYAIIKYLNFDLLMGVIVSYCICHLVYTAASAITARYVKTKIYNDDEELFKSHAMSIMGEAPKAPPAAETSNQHVNVEATFNIVAKPDAPIARFMGADIYEWYDFESTTGTERFVYYGTIDIKNSPGFTVPDGCVVISPGIIYRHISLEG